MPRLSEWVQTARHRWPRSHRDKRCGAGIWGDGQYAVLNCAYRHPSTHTLQYSTVWLFATKQQAITFKRALDVPSSAAWKKPLPPTGFTPYCHADQKHACSHDHEMIDLLLDIPH